MRPKKPPNATHMSLLEVYLNPKVSVLEEKFSLIRQSDTDFIGKYPLEPFKENGRGTYGGEFVAQSLAAALETVRESEFHPHSLHSYFLKAGQKESPMRYEVTTTSEGRNFCNRLVKCYQLHTNQLCFIAMISFMKNNSIAKRKIEFAALEEHEKRHPRAKVPFEFLRQPHFTFDKYINKIDTLPQIVHTNGNMLHAVPPETYELSSHEEGMDTGSKEFGLFFKVNDNLDLARDKLKARFVDLAFASDSFYLGTLARAMHIPMTEKGSTDFFRVSLDHVVYFHDIDFDPTDWMFLDYKFVRMSNDRVLVAVLIFTRDRRLIATVTQEAVAFLPLRLVDRARGGTYKL